MAGPTRRFSGEGKTDYGLGVAYRTLSVGERGKKAPGASA
jgi:hypothetical protein